MTNPFAETAFLVQMDGCLYTRSQDSTQAHKDHAELLRFPGDPVSSLHLLCTHNPPENERAIRFIGNRLTLQGLDDLKPTLVHARNIGQIAPETIQVVLPSGEIFKID